MNDEGRVGLSKLNWIDGHGSAVPSRAQEKKRKKQNHETKTSYLCRSTINRQQAHTDDRYHVENGYRVISKRSIFLLSSQKLRPWFSRPHQLIAIIHQTMITRILTVKSVFAVTLVVLGNFASSTTTADAVGNKDSSMEHYYLVNAHVRRQLQMDKRGIKGPPTKRPTASRTTRPPTKSVSPIFIIINPDLDFLLSSNLN